MELLDTFCLEKAHIFVLSWRLGIYCCLGDISLDFFILIPLAFVQTSNWKLFKHNKIINLISAFRTL